MENEKRLDLIDRKALLKTLDRYINPMPNESGYEFLRGIATAITEIEDSPTVDAVEVVHGRWEESGVADYKCSRCGFRFTSADPISMFQYCRCGAKMDGGNEDV